MIPSGSKSKESNRPHSSTGFRPASRNVLRPQSSIGQRPQSSLSARIPTASRPQSRLSQRPSSRQARSRLKPHCESLVAALIGTNESENFQDLAEYVASRLEGTTLQKAAASVDITVIDRQISGWVVICASLDLAKHIFPVSQRRPESTLMMPSERHWKRVTSV